MRLIDADALKESLTETLHRCDEWIENAKDGETRTIAESNYTAFLESILRVKDAPTIDGVPRWIPCKERLPGLDEICLVTEKDGSIRHCYFDSVDPVLFATVEEGMYVRNVVAWMPLPEPYEGERKDDECMERNDDARRSNEYK